MKSKYEKMEKAHLIKKIHQLKDDVKYWKNEASIQRDRVPDLPRLLTPEQVSEFLGITKASLMRWRAEGVGPQFVKLISGRKQSLIRYRDEDVREYINGSLHTSVSSAAMEHGHY